MTRHRAVTKSTTARTHENDPVSSFRVLVVFVGPAIALLSCATLLAQGRQLADDENPEDRSRNRRRDSPASDRNSRFQI